MSIIFLPQGFYSSRLKALFMLLYVLAQNKIYKSPHIDYWELRQDKNRQVDVTNHKYKGFVRELESKFCAARRQNISTKDIRREKKEKKRNQKQPVAFHPFIPYHNFDPQADFILALWKAMFVPTYDQKQALTF